MNEKEKEKFKKQAQKAVVENIMKIVSNVQFEHEAEEANKRSLEKKALMKEFGFDESIIQDRVLLQISESSNKRLYVNAKLGKLEEMIKHPAFDQVREQIKKECNWLLGIPGIGTDGIEMEIEIRGEGRMDFFVTYLALELESFLKRGNDAYPEFNKMGKEVRLKTMFGANGGIDWAEEGQKINEIINQKMQQTRNSIVEVFKRELEKIDEQSRKRTEESKEVRQKKVSEKIKKNVDPLNIFLQQIKP